MSDDSYNTETPWKDEHMVEACAKRGKMRWELAR